MKLFARRFGDNLDAGLQRIAVVHEHEIRAASAEEFGEHLLEIHADFFERLGEEFLRGPVDFRNHLEQFGLRVDEVGILFFKKNIPLLELVEFLNGVDIDRFITEKAETKRHMLEEFFELATGLKAKPDTATATIITTETTATIAPATVDEDPSPVAS